MKSKIIPFYKKPRMIFGIIGLIIGILPLDVFIIDLFPKYQILDIIDNISDSILYGPRLFIENNFDCLSCHGLFQAFIVLMLISILLYTTIGVIFGLLIEFIFKIYKRIRKN